jgi:hypothetical protein
VKTISEMQFAATIALLAGSAAAFAPNQMSKASTSLKAMSFDNIESLPGVLPPMGVFDPLGLATNAVSLKRYREAELQHGRVAMLAAVGMFVTEEPIEFHPLFYSGVKDIGPAIRHLDEVRAVEPIFFEIFAVFIGILELNRALNGWKAPSGDAEFQDLNDDYFPGDINFDPLGLKPSGEDEFKTMCSKEIQNGRLAMLGVAGMVAQELVNGKEIFVNLGLAADRFDPSSVPIQF